jgi:hypothetical protein
VKFSTNTTHRKKKLWYIFIYYLEKYCLMKRDVSSIMYVHTYHRTCLVSHVHTYIGSKDTYYINVWYHIYIPYDTYHTYNIVIFWVSFMPYPQLSYDTILYAYILTLQRDCVSIKKSNIKKRQKGKANQH